MIQNILRQTFGAAGSQPGSLANQDLNGVLVYSSIGFTASQFLTVNLKSSKHQAEVLVNRVSLLALAELSDAEAGQSPSLQALLEGLATGFVATATTPTVVANAATTPDYTGHVLYVPVGLLKNRSNDASLEILIEMDAACTISVAAAYFQNGEDHAIRTLETRQLSDRMDDIDSLWLFNPTATNAPHTLDLSVLVKSAYGSTVCNAMDLFAYTGAMKAIEAWAPKHVVCVFDSADAIHDAVSWSISGTDAVTWGRIISRSVWRDPNRIERGRGAEVSRIEGVLAKKSGAQRLALSRAGIVDHGLLAQVRRDIQNVEG